MVMGTGANPCEERHAPTPPHPVKDGVGCMPTGPAPAHTAFFENPPTDNGGIPGTLALWQGPDLVPRGVWHRSLLSISKRNRTARLADWAVRPHYANTPSTGIPAAHG